MTSRPSPALAALGVAALALLTYLPSLGNGFVNWDDGHYIVENPIVHRFSLAGLAWAFTTFQQGNWHPLTWLSHMGDGTLFGLAPWGHHATSALLHAANAAVLLLVLHRLTGSLARSALVAALFAVHPLNVESVAWASERKNVLSTLFWFLTLGAYARYAGAPSRRRFAAVVLLFALGLMAKPMLVTLPITLLLLDAWPLGRFSRRAVVEKLPLFALSAASSVVTVAAQRAGSALTPLDAIPIGARVANAAVSCVRYLEKAVWPSPLSALYPLPGGGEAPPISPVELTVAALALAGVTAACVRLRRRRPHLLFGWLWYLATLLPVIGLVQVGSQGMADRYAYVPLVGIFVAVVWSVPQTLLRRAPVVAGAAATVLLLAATAARRERVWRDSIALFEDALRTHPRNSIALNNLGVALMDRGRLDDAIARYRQALEVDSVYVHARFNLAQAYWKQDRGAEARVEYERTLALRPDFAEAHRGLGLILAGEGKAEAAIAEYRAALLLDPGSYYAHNNIGLVLLQEGRADEAAGHFEAAQRLRPDEQPAWSNLGLARARQGRYPEAAALLESAIRMRPDDADARVNLGMVLCRTGDLAGALDQFQEAIRLAPGNPKAHNNRGVALAGLGRVAEAQAAFREALSLDPEYAEARNNLARAEGR